MIDKLLFNSKHWQLFLFFFVPWLLDIMYASFGHEGRIFFAFILVVWIPLLGIRLRKYLPQHYSLHYLMFLIAIPIIAFDMVYRLVMSNPIELGLWFLQPRLNLLYDQYFRD